MDYLVNFVSELEDLAAQGIALPIERLMAAVNDTLARHSAPRGATVNIVFTSDEEVRRLNAQYRGVDAPTDVLSFGAEPLPAEIAAAMDAPELGDLLIALPYTMRQAADANHTLADELVLLAVHGTLHLIGFDHDTAQAEENMWRAQNEALQAAGVAFAVPRFTFEDAEGATHEG